MTWTQFIASYWMLLLLGAIIAYLLGSFNFAIIITKVIFAIAAAAMPERPMCCDRRARARRR